MAESPLFQSFFLGGFECSTHRNRSNTRLDLLTSTRHDHHVYADYQRLLQHNIRAARDGIRWHLIEQTPGIYDFSSVLPMIHAARDTQMQVVWDLCHYGWPDDIDIFSLEFIRRFKRMARAFIRLLVNETDDVPFVAPVNEISYFAWAGGEVGWMSPFTHWRGYELKVQLARAAIEAVDVIRGIAPKARIVHCDPAINVIPNCDDPHSYHHAAGHHRSQFEAWDMISGQHLPELGGSPSHLDIIGVNYYSHNQWIHPGRTINRHHPLYKPFREILQDVYMRYQRPLFVSETGDEGDARVDWLRYVCEEVRAAIEMGVPVQGVCIYPILDYPGWDDDRICQSGLWGYADESGERPICQEFADELHRQQALMEAALSLEYS